MMIKVRVGLIGLGRFGRLHAEILASLPEVELAAVCDVRPEALTEVATEFDTDPRLRLRSAPGRNSRAGCRIDCGTRPFARAYGQIDLRARPITIKQECQGCNH